MREYYASYGTYFIGSVQMLPELNGAAEGFIRSLKSAYKKLYAEQVAIN